jgi:hypothetical protein
LELELEREQE